MNTQNESMAVTEARKYKKLEALPEEKQELVLELAARTKLLDLVEILKEHGVETSVSTLRRFLLRQREREVLAAGEEMENVEALARRGKGETLRKGSLEALRQRLYEQAMVTVDPEKARELYQDLLKEEAKIKELELDERKAAALEEQVKLQRLRIEVMAAGGGGNENGRKRTQGSQRNGMVIEAGPVIAGELAGPSEREFVEGEELPRMNAESVKKYLDSEGKDFTKGNEGNEERREGRLAEFWERMGEILNRGGRPEEKVLAARAVWEEGREAFGR
jgi:hypothetical protein